MKINQLAELHKRVIHTDYMNVNETDIEQEDIWVKKYPYDLLKNVCVDCFSDVDQDVDLLVPESN